MTGVSLAGRRPELPAQPSSFVPLDAVLERRGGPRAGRTSSVGRLVGPEAIALGSDLNGFVFRPPPGGACPAGIRKSSDLPALFAGLQAARVPREAVDGSGEALLRSWERALAAADAAGGTAPP